MKMIPSRTTPTYTLVPLLLAGTIVLVFQVTPALGHIRNISFAKLALCSDSFPGTEIVYAKSKVTCALLCLAQGNCTAYSYRSNGTCKLHQSDLTSQACGGSNSTTSAYKLERSNTNQGTTHGIHCQNGGNAVNETACQCYNGYVGTYCERLMVDCAEGKNSGYYPSMSGMYLALPVGQSVPIQVRCHPAVQHIVQERWQDNVNFNVSFSHYVNGFGGASTDYWLGLEKLHLITTNPYNYNLCLQVGNVSSVDFYQHYYLQFKVKSAAEGYAMSFTSNRPGGPPSIPIGDCLTPLQNKRFSAFDNDNDNNSSRNCAADYAGGWWFDEACSECNLMGKLRWFTLTRIPGAVDEVFYLPGMNPPDFSPANTLIFLYRL